MERTEAATLLGVKLDASPRQVRSAFRKRVRAEHPDREGSSDTDFQRLVEARDLLLIPAPEPEPEPEIIRPPSPPTPPPTTLTYGYEPFKGREHEGFITRPPAASLGSQNRASRSLIGRLRRLGWQVLAMGALALLFFQLVLQGLLGSSDMCVGSSNTGPIQVSCSPQSEMLIEATFDDINADCPAPTERLRVGSEVWCLTPYR